jgi:hypothetical protein
MTRSPDSPEKPLDLQLFCGKVLVGSLLDVFVHQGTWFAKKFRHARPRRVDKNVRRIREYIAFSNDWHDRLANDQDPDPSEYQERFKDLMKSGLWRIRPKGGEEIPVEIPGFIGEEISWRVPECDTGPSPEVAAWELWSRLTNGSS